MKKDSVKIVTIGGGSSYTPELVEGFIKRYDTLPVRELWLVDIEEGREKLETVGALAQRMAKKAGLPMKVILSYDCREALPERMADQLHQSCRNGDRSHLPPQYIAKSHRAVQCPGEHGRRICKDAGRRRKGSDHGDPGRQPFYLCHRRICKRRIPIRGTLGKICAPETRRHHPDEKLCVAALLAGIYQRAPRNPLPLSQLLFLHERTA